MKNQTILSGNGTYQELQNILEQKGIENPLLVCGNSFNMLPFYNSINPIFNVHFSDFDPNPTYDSVCNGVLIFLNQKCDAIVAIGGGSAMDVAKCIKLFATLDHSCSYLTQTAQENAIPLIVLPTTAGTGSESTHFAVIYERGEKQSIQHNCILPDVVLLEPSALTTLPLYQKKCTMLDALCQAIESMWSVHSTSESIALSQKAISMILDNIDIYLDNSVIGNEKMLFAANLAGQAINITQTTAPHAMSYMLTSLFEIPHGHAVALCLPHVWSYMLEHLENCTDVRGIVWVEDVFQKIAVSMGQETVTNAIHFFNNLLTALEVKSNLPISEIQLDLLSDSVNVDRLKNTPVLLNRGELYICYRNIQ